MTLIPFHIIMSLRHWRWHHRPLASTPRAERTTELARVRKFPYRLSFGSVLSKGTVYSRPTPTAHSGERGDNSDIPGESELPPRPTNWLPRNGYKLWVVGRGSWVVGCGWWIVGCGGRGGISDIPNKLNLGRRATSRRDSIVVGPVTSPDYTANFLVSSRPVVGHRATNVSQPYFECKAPAIAKQRQL